LEPTDSVPSFIFSPADLNPLPILLEKDLAPLAMLWPKLFVLSIIPLPEPLLSFATLVVVALSLCSMAGC